jgi:hypothetical protein
MKTEYKYLRFTQIGDTGKTTRWACMNHVSICNLGEIRWYGPWRQYCYYPPIESIFSAGCLQDIADFIKQLMDNRLTPATKQKE